MQKINIPNFSLITAWRGFATSLSAMLFLLIGTTLPSHVNANDINVHPSACVAPFLSQAQPLRWHELYLMNPATNVSTWVICPMTFDVDVVKFMDFDVVVEGGVMSGASSDLPRCFFAVAGKDNLDQPPFILGNPKKFSVALSVSKTGARWGGVAGFVTQADIQADIGTPVLSDWVASVFCQLPPGHSITLIRLTDFSF